MSDSKTDKTPLCFQEAPEEPTPNINNKLAKPEDMTWGDYLWDPSRPLTSKHRRLAQLLALGKKNSQIQEELGYAASTISNLKTSTKIKREVEKFQDRLFEPEIEARLKTLAPDAIDTIEQHLNDPDISAAKKVDAAKWLIEKLTGRPAQQVDHSGDISLSVYMDELDKMKESGQIIDVSPKALAEPAQTEDNESAAEVDELSDWVTKNI